MTLGRIAGPLLESNLDRNGVPLVFSSNGSPLLDLDFQNLRASINCNVTSATFAVNGNVELANIKVDGDTLSSTTGNIHLGNVTGLKIDGGSSNYIMTTDGSGNLSWQDISTVSHDMNLSANNIKLGTVLDQSVINYSAYRYWESNTAVSDALDNLNQVMLNVYQNTYVGAVGVDANNKFGPSPLTVQFTASILGNPDTFHWDFGDGYTSNQQNPTHTYDNPSGGLYTVYFKASNSAGTLGGAGSGGEDALGLAQGSYADVTLQEYIRLYTPAPIPTFTLDASTVNNGSNVVFHNTSQYAESYVIHWGDGTTTTIANNNDAGGPGQSPVYHTYNNINGDTQYNITLDAYSSTAGLGGLTVSSAPHSVLAYSEHLPLMSVNPSSGNNQHASVPNGLVVTFTNNTVTNPGATATFPGNRYEYIWGDGTTTSVNIGVGAAGDVGHTISHAYTLIDPTVQQTFVAQLKVFNGHSFSPFMSTTELITVYPAPTALFNGSPAVTSDRIGDTPQVGYLITDLDGVNRAAIQFNNESYNTTQYQWTYGDGNLSSVLFNGNPGSPTGGPLAHIYLTQGQYNVSLLATGPGSLSPTDDTLTKSQYITILPAPVAPAGLGAKTLTIASTGTSPLLVANATNNSSVSIPVPPGAAVSRVTTMSPLESSIVSNAYTASNGSLTAIVNGISEAPIVLTGNNDTGTYGSLVITEDKDAHSIDPAVYPSRFYSVFSGKMSKSNASVAVGHNSFQVSHSTTGSTNVLSFIKDDVTAVPALNVTSSSITATGGTYRYVSGVPYFTSDGTAAIHGVAVHNWIGQTYLDSLSPLQVTSGTVLEGTGTPISLQGKTYAQLDGAITYLSGGIPKANTGKTSGTPYTFGSIPVAINNIAAVAGKLKLQISNVNGASSQVELPTELNVYSSAITGLDETNIPVSLTLGGTYTDNGKRIVLPAGATPAFTSSHDYFTNDAFTGAVTVQGTDEAIIRFGTLRHNTTDYSSFVPPGPNLSGRPGTQYFKFAFRRSTVANFNITYTGKISGMWIAAPGTQIDQASSLNGWLNCSQVYAGAGVPGDVTGIGNGSLGCAKGSGDVVPLGTQVTAQTFTMTLGSANSSDATGNQILVSIALNAGDSLTSISIS